MKEYPKPASRGNETSLRGMTLPPPESASLHTHAAESGAQVLIVSNQADFARTIVARWQMERAVPAFTMMSSEVCRQAPKMVFGVAIVAPGAANLESVLSALHSSGIPVIYVAGEDSAGHSLTRPATVVLRQAEGWVDVLIELAKEILLRREAYVRMQRAEERADDSQGLATLGRYILEMRHSLNNCLTSVLGNAELLLLEPGIFTAETRDQIHTIHTMALRMHEVLQRFSTLESEMQFAEKDSHSETKAKSQVAGRPA